MTQIHPNRHTRLAGLLTCFVLAAGAILMLMILLRPQDSSTPAAPAQTPDPTAEPGPLSGWVILVDPGHGGYDGGARARTSGVWEKELTLDVALAVEKNLQQRGAQVVMTRREDVDLTTPDRPSTQTKKRQDMQARVDLAVSSGANMVLSIHMNEYRDSRESGPQVFYRQGSESSRLLAGCLQESLIQTLQPTKKRSALPGDYFILQLDVPSALIECGFISNAAEEGKLLSPDYQELVGEAVAGGVEEYIRLQAH